MKLGPRHTDDLLATLANAREFCGMHGASAELMGWLATCSKRVEEAARQAKTIKVRLQIKNPITGTWTKRDDRSGRFLDVKADPKPFKGVRREK